MNEAWAGLHDLRAAVGWPVAIALAWLLGEVGHRRLGVPRISLYGIVGFVLGSHQLGLLPPSGGGPIALLAHIAFGLILFEFGYRVNLRWLRTNPWIGAAGVLEALATFVGVFLMAQLSGLAMLPALLLASLSMSTSPAALLRVINELRCAGQVTERALHLAALDCVLAVFFFKVIVGVWIFQSSGQWLQAVGTSLVQLSASAGLGLAAGAAVPGLLRRMGRLSEDTTVVFALAVILIVAIAHALSISPLLATLTFGLVARHRRVVLNQAQRNFGALGDLLGIVLFVFVGTTIAADRAWAGLSLAVAVIVVRVATKVLVVGALARASGITGRKGLLTGLAMTPNSVFVILMLEQTRHLGTDLLDLLAPLAAAALLLELIGPIVTQRALVLAGETGASRES